jgi:hypothetical protein
MCEKWSNTDCQGGQKYSTLSKEKEGYLDWSHLACELSSKHVIEIKIEERKEVTERQRRRRKLLLDGLKERRGQRKSKEETLDRIVWRSRFVTGCGPLVRETTWRNGSPASHCRLSRSIPDIFARNLRNTNWRWDGFFWILRISPVGISLLILHTNSFICFQNIRTHRIWGRLQITHLKHIKIGHLDHKIRRLMLRCFTITPLLLLAWGILKASVQSLYLFPLSRHSSPPFFFFLLQVKPPPPPRGGVLRGCYAGVGVAAVAGGGW